MLAAVPPLTTDSGTHCGSCNAKGKGGRAGEGGRKGSAPGTVIAQHESSAAGKGCRHVSPLAAIPPLSKLPADVGCRSPHLLGAHKDDKLLIVGVHRAAWAASATSVPCGVMGRHAARAAARFIKAGRMGTCMHVIARTGAGPAGCTAVQKSGQGPPVVGTARIPPGPAYSTSPSPFAAAAASCGCRRRRIASLLALPRIHLQPAAKVEAAATAHTVALPPMRAAQRPVPTTHHRFGSRPCLLRTSSRALLLLGCALVRAARTGRVPAKAEDLHCHRRKASDTVYTPMCSNRPSTQPGGHLLRAARLHGAFAAERLATRA